MPVYEYFFEACEEQFEAVLTLREHDNARVTCPTCGSDRVHQMAAAFTAVTSKKS